MNDVGQYHERIADLLGWARRISDARGMVDPAQRKAFLAAKHALLDQLTHDQSTKDEQ